MIKMFMFVKLICFLLSLILVSCTSIETLKRVKPKGDKFSYHLFELYKTFAEKEAEQYDWLDSQHFINKAMAIVYGKDVLPEKVEDWEVPEKQMKELQTKRINLMGLLEKKELRDEYPIVLAEAQFNFDCLLEEMEENWQDSDIKKCTDGYNNSVDFLKQQLTKTKTGEVKKDAAKETAIASTATIVSDNKPAHVSAKKEQLLTAKEYFAYRIFFEFDSDELTLGAKNALKKIAKEVKQMSPQPEEISLNGYTDKAGKEEYNLALSKKRANMVKKFIIDQGVEAKKIVIYAFGEADTAIESAEGNKEPGSRRVEISIVD